MSDHYTPIQIAQQLMISTTTLRRYEEQGLIPDVPRSASNHRNYTAVHMQAFATINALLRAYEIPVAYEVMRKVNNEELSDALWLVNQRQYKMQEEKLRVEEMLRMLRDAHWAAFEGISADDAMTIGEVARIAQVNASAIRHWEQEGLIASKRNEDNGYRIFTLTELRKILLISSLRKTVYDIDNMKQLLQELDTRHYEQVEQSVQLALQKLNGQLSYQFAAIAELMKYVDLRSKTAAAE
ncbi:DNA-binding transcriptional MerR regulator [Paenibacillus cellulosilyticus]|uniref:DNA-binding transcriptional MerR regulator n=1 Tax=Paenibacillus cellulosilyticus TaxID=375489 RepID=A0A2V2YQE8_9BACL|nr:MerR family transcriptional regulator [Paenibacillus cellulosilyticus]PWV95875.1 DNA-binding transcriptional MerR regulator [Paenibacillus cellulosilyticus]QKS47745.1 MerR family transcriptional regulator [Paenibacillus cellulosilyticus]